MKKAIYLVGAGLIIGSATMAIYQLRKKKNNDNPECKESEKKQSPAEEMPLPKNATTQEEPIYENIKSSAIENMYSRHEDAAIAMKESVESIRENVKVSTDTNNEIDEVAAELNKLLSED